MSEVRHFQARWRRWPVGQRQRLALAVAALVNHLEVVVLDEPSARLDPRTRRNLWELILRLKPEGRTAILTTHYRDEAAFLADRLAMVDHDRALDDGAPWELIPRHMPAAVVDVS